MILMQVVAARFGVEAKPLIEAGGEILVRQFGEHGLVESPIVPASAPLCLPVSHLLVPRAKGSGAPWPQPALRVESFNQD